MEHFRSNESLADRDTFETEDEEQLVTETRELLNSLDEEALRDIFERELTRAGVKNADQQTQDRFIPFKKVLLRKGNKGQHMGYYSREHGIELYPSVILTSSQVIEHRDTLAEINRLAGQWLEVNREEGAPLSHQFTNKRKKTELSQKIERLEELLNLDGNLRTKILATILTVHALAHEELHALTSDKVFSVTSTQSAEGTTYLGGTNIGFHEYSYLMTLKPGSSDPVINEDFDRFAGLNEGVTELINRRLAKALLEQTLPQRVLSTDINAFYDLVEIGSYNRERWVAEQLVALFSVIAEVPQDVVERSLFRSYLNGGDFLPKELVAAVRHDVPQLSQEQVEQMLLKLQIAISEKGFETETDINRIFIEFADLLPPAKRDAVKDAFQELFYKYSFSRELKDGVVEM